MKLGIPIEERLDYLHTKFGMHICNCQASSCSFFKYDIGGAEELQFSDCCRRGAITAVCGKTVLY